MSPLDRRTFLTRSTALLGAVGAGGVAGGAAAAARAAEIQQQPGDVNAEVGAAASATDLVTQQPFSGVHQNGILNPPPAQATFVALDSFAPDRASLMQALRVLSTRAQALTVGGPIPLLEIDAPPADSGTLGPDNAPDALTVTIGLGASLFDGRYGLGGQRPRELTQMPTFPVDQLDPAQSHGDLLLQICAQHRDTVVHTLRELLRSVRGTFQQRWSIDGFASAGRGPTPKNNPRNLFGFRDGTANPPTTDASLMNQLVWAGAGEPGWAAGGTYQVVRIIRMHVEFWDRVALREQQTMIGRARDTGAPLGGTTEFEDPRYDLDPHGQRIPLDAHIRLANPRTSTTTNQRILRRGFNYHRGFDHAGQLDQGLVFVAFNQSPSRQFVTIQERLNAEPMVDYITPVGGGYFFVPPGAQGAEFVGSGLFA
ncbi:MAG TPA: iron uptake transporter deferrochelatase/peroxidase subunit [Solirubrobacteraceae bacterium]|jgi:deferrochelatase/peroxidase EfeB|nr:iron uptake transporter deferrochelatase/peroxidase subunit [Solirubrobacteraceae bacterium]